MRKPSALPIEFSTIADRVHYVREVVHGTEWAGSCPNCGGEVHRNGEWPDRCRFWPHSTKAGGKALAWCRSCGWKWTPKREEKIDPAKAREMAEERARAEAVHEQAVADARARVRKEKKWEHYYRLLLKHPMAQDAWRKVLGLSKDSPMDLLKYWQLGCSIGHEFWMPGEDGRMKMHKSNTLTIPITDLDGKCINIKHRLGTVGEDGIRYRQEYRGVGEAIFIANRALMNKADYAIIAEGEKKAMVSYITAGLQSHLQVFGMPLSPSLELMGAINAQHIVYIPDPDSFDRELFVNRSVSVWARRDFRIVRLPDKLDDYILATHKNSNWILNMFNLPTWWSVSKSGKKWSEYD